MSSVWQWIAVLTVTVIADFFWAKWSIACGEKLPYRAALYGGAIVACGSFAIVEYTANHWLVIPAILGASIGTFVAVKRS